MNKIIIIGAGASGMTAAISAARHGAEVTLLEHKDRIGKKILSTGNGRCNYTNLSQHPDCYRCENPSFPWPVIQKFDEKAAVRFFQELGICPRERDGCLYPASGQASAVLDVLRMELNRLGVRVYTGIHVLKVSPEKRGFLVKASETEIRADKVILCTGSKSAPSTGSDGSGYEIARKLGHRIVPVLPALVQLRCQEDFYKSISGVRVYGRVALYTDGTYTAADTGEIQLTDYGISGIPVFQVSRYAAKALWQKKKVTAVLNFLPDLETAQVFSFLKERSLLRPEKTMEDFFTGVFHKKLAALFIRLSQISRQKKAGELDDAQWLRLSRLISCFETRITATNSFEQAQICCGGVDTRDVCKESLESLRIPGLYFAGEILDVDGMCGGYNLQWAWASGYLAGKEAANASDQSD